MKTGKKLNHPLLKQQRKRIRNSIEYGEAAFYGPKLDFMVKDALVESGN